MDSGAGDLAAARRDVGREVAHEAVGRGDLDVDDRLEHDRRRLEDRVDHGLAPGGHEGDFLRVHGVALAVVDDDADVLDRIAGDDAVVERLAHALLHRRDEHRRDHAALHLVDELEAAAARERLDLEEHLAELAGAAGLLLVAAVAFGLARDRLAVGDLGRLGVDLQLVLRAASSPAWRACAGRPGRASRSRAWSGGARSTGTDPRPPACAARRRGAARRPSSSSPPRCACIGVRELQRAQVDVVLVVRIVQHGVELDLLDLGHRADVAGDQRVGLDVFLALELVEVADLERPLAVADEELRVLRDRALVDAEYARPCRRTGP